MLCENLQPETHLVTELARQLKKREDGFGCSCGMRRLGHVHYYCTLGWTRRGSCDRSQSSRVRAAPHVQAVRHRPLDPSHDANLHLKGVSGHAYIISPPDPANRRRNRRHAQNGRRRRSTMEPRPDCNLGLLVLHGQP